MWLGLHPIRLPKIPMSDRSKDGGPKPLPQNTYIFVWILASVASMAIFKVLLIILSIFANLKPLISEKIGLGIDRLVNCTFQPVQC